MSSNLTHKQTNIISRTTEESYYANVLDMFMDKDSFFICRLLLSAAADWGWQVMAMTIPLYNRISLVLKKETHGITCIVSIFPCLRVRSDKYFEALDEKWADKHSHRWIPLL
jgi:hypothetical protein